MYSIEEKKQLVTNFWNGFNMYCSHQPFLKGRRRIWMLHKTKVPHVQLKFDPGRDGIQIILELLHRNENERLEVYELLERCKTILEDGFSNGLIWDFAYMRENGQEVCRIYTEKKGLDIHRQRDWEEMYEFMAANMLQMEKNFLEVRELITK